MEAPLPQPPAWRVEPSRFHSTSSAGISSMNWLAGLYWLWPHMLRTSERVRYRRFRARVRPTYASRRSSASSLGSVAERWCGNSPCSMPVRNTTGNSRPLAVCRVIRVTTPSRLASATAAASSSAAARRGVRDLVGVGHEGDLFQEGAERTLGVVPLVFTDDGDEFGEVLHPGLVLRVGAGPQGCEVAGLFQDGFQGGGRAGAGGHLGEVVEQFHEALDRVDGAGGHAGGLVGAAGGGHEGDPVALRRGRPRRPRPGRRCRAWARSGCGGG